MSRLPRVPVAVTLALLAVAVVAGGEPTTLGLAGRGSTLQLTAPTWTYAAGAAVLCALAAVATYRAQVRDRQRLVLALRGVVVGVAVVAVLTWSAHGSSVNLGAILAMTLASAVPIMLGSTSGVLAERSGTFNIAIEGQLLLGAFTAALVATLTDNAWIGLLAGMVAGLANAAVLAVLTVTYRVDQVVAGFILVSLSTGLTGYLTAQVMVPNLDAYNSPPTLPSLHLPFLSDLPLVGKALFGQNAVFYVCVALIVAAHYLLGHTVLGLRIRAAGENPAATLSAGVDARRVRLWTTTVAGGVGGLGGAAFTIGSAGQFVAGMSSGLGFVALAAVILGGWRPVFAACAALLFGFASALAAVLGLLGVDVPPSLLLLTPYVVTIVVVANTARRHQAPAAAGRPIG